MGLVRLAIPLACSLLVARTSLGRHPPRLPNEVEQRHDIPVFKWVPNIPHQTSFMHMRRHVRRELGSALDAHALHLSRRARRLGQPGNLTQIKNAFLDRFTSRLLRRAGRTGQHLLPDALPPLPVSLDLSVQQLIDRGKSCTRTNRGLFVYLERQAANLRGSSRPEDRQVSTRLREYLASYKDGWAGSWLEQRLRAFGHDQPEVRGRPVIRFNTAALPGGGVSMPLLPKTDDPAIQAVIDRGKSPTGTARDLYLYLLQEQRRLSRSTDRGDRTLGWRVHRYLRGYRAGLIPATHQAQIRQRIADAWSIAQQIVHPGILTRMPRLTFEVSYRYSVPGIVKRKDGNRLITLLPDSSVKDILHEIGHQVGYHGGLRPIAAAHAELIRRSFGLRDQGLGQLIPNTGYSESQRGYAGGFVDPYMGRAYKDGWTEGLSMVMERLENPQRAMELFYQDGHQLLTFLGAIQQRPLTTRGR